jgi:hypothetical protein
MQVGLIKDWTSKAPLLSIGNAVDTLHPFGVISDFRVYLNTLPQSMVQDSNVPFNTSPRTKIFSSNTTTFLKMYMGEQEEETKERGEQEPSHSDHRKPTFQGVRAKIQRRVSLRSRAVNALKSQETHAAPEGRTLMKTDGVYKEGKAESLVAKIKHVQPWTLLQEYHVLYKLGDEDQGVRVLVLVDCGGWLGG